MKPEKIVCGAVRINYENMLSGEKKSKVILCIDYYDDNHENEVFKIEVSKYFCIESTVLGFITNKNRFVDAKEAMDIAINNDQLKVIKEKESEYFKYSQIGERQEVLDAIISDILSLQNLYKGRDLTIEDLY